MSKSFDFVVTMNGSVSRWTIASENLDDAVDVLVRKVGVDADIQLYEPKPITFVDVQQGTASTAKIFGRRAAKVLPAAEPLPIRPLSAPTEASARTDRLLSADGGRLLRYAYAIARRHIAGRLSQRGMPSREVTSYTFEWELPSGAISTAKRRPRGARLVAKHKHSHVRMTTRRGQQALGDLVDHAIELALVRLNTGKRKLPLIMRVDEHDADGVRKTIRSAVRSGCYDALVASGCGKRRPLQSADDPEIAAAIREIPQSEQESTDCDLAIGEVCRRNGITGLDDTIVTALHSGLTKDTICALLKLTPNALAIRMTRIQQSLDGTLDAHGTYHSEGHVREGLLKLLKDIYAELHGQTRGLLAPWENELREAA